MRHFAHHIGDYASATAHLSFVEDAAYHRLLRLYYRDERPLPADIATCQRITGARSKEERRAVETILREFFELLDDGWHQARADREIGSYQSKSDVARENGRSGGRPRTRDKPENNPAGFPSEPNEKLTKNHEPVTKNQHDMTRASRASQIPDDWKPTEALIEYAKAQGCRDPADTLERFRLHHGGKGTKHKNWTMAAQLWCRNERSFRRSDPEPPKSQGWN